MNNDIIPSLTLCIDAAFNFRRFAITTIDGQPVWFGRFFENDGHISNPATAEKAAAMKAVWLAGKVREAIGATRLHLRLLTDAQWLTMPLGQAKELHDSAAYRGLEFRPFWIAGKSNPADTFTRCNGFQKADVLAACELVSETTMDQINEEDAAERDRKETDFHKDRTGPTSFEKRPDQQAQAERSASLAQEQKAHFAAAGVSIQDDNEWTKSHKAEWEAIKAAVKTEGLPKKEAAIRRLAAAKAWVDAGKPQPVNA